MLVTFQFLSYLKKVEIRQNPYFYSKFSISYLLSMTHVNLMAVGRRSRTCRPFFVPFGDLTVPKGFSKIDNTLVYFHYSQC